MRYHEWKDDTDDEPSEETWRLNPKDDGLLEANPVLEAMGATLVRETFVVDALTLDSILICCTSNLILSDLR